MKGMKTDKIKSWMVAICGVFWVFAGNAAVSLFSDYGQIQNVQKYSTNPFWTPNSPYNMRLPQPIYAQGADLNTADCMNVVQSMVAAQCMARNNCRDTKLSEIRPEIMVQLSRLPNNNYVSACAGYIDGIFDSYVKQYGNLPTGNVGFPNATVQNPSINNSNGAQIQNPYQRTTPQWQQDINERTRELESLQRENGYGSEHISAVDFPETYADLSFNSRMQLMADGYEPYKDLKTYRELTVLDDNAWCAKDKTSPECLEYMERISNCTAEMLEKDENVVRAIYSNPFATNRVCRIVQCVAGMRPNQNGSACILDHGTPCVLNVEHEVLSEIDANGNCVLRQCEPGYVPYEGLTCIEETAAMTSAAAVSAATGGGVSGTTTATPYTNNEPEELDENDYYFARIRHGTLDRAVNNYCYDVCGVHQNTSDLNKSVFIPVLGEAYCVNPRSPYDFYDSETQKKQLKMTRAQYKKVTEEALNIRDKKGRCDGFVLDVDLVFYHVKNNQETKIDTIRLDD